MTASRLPRLSFLILAGGTLLVATPRSARADDTITGVTAIAAKASSDYVRARLPNGTFEPEFYSFGEGGNWGGQQKDASIDKLKFLDVAHVIAGPLAERNYLPARDPAKTRLLIMVYWGTTKVPPPAEEDPLYFNYQLSLDEYNMLMSQHQIGEADAVLTAGLKQLQIANHQRDQIDFNNAMMIGYDADGLVGTDYGKYIEHTALGTTEKDEVQEIEENRYFVVLMAYDFQLLWKKKLHKLLWETRFSINERHNQFNKALPAMALEASKYFGQNLKGLLRKEVPLGTVEIGDVKSLGEVEGPKK
jgi:hypothetical protein